MDEFMSPLSEAGANLRELFETLVNSGFTESQTLTMLGVMLAHTGSAAGE